MKATLALALLAASAAAYDRNAAVNYASTWWNSANHDCSGAYTDCSPYSYWGGESCSYGSHGGDCANFVSQCVLAGGHAALNTGGDCRGYPCGVEEVGATKLGNCLNSFGWERTCGYLQAPPSNIQPGDVIIYHADSCSSYEAHATFVVGTDNGSVQIACHSNNRWAADYTYIQSTHPYFEWLHINA